MLARYAHSTVETTALTAWPIRVTDGSLLATPLQSRTPAVRRNATAAEIQRHAPAIAPGRQSRQWWRTLALKRYRQMRNPTTSASPIGQRTTDHTEL